MGNGQQVWELFGHNAIWIHDRVTNRDTVFNWGVFDFRQPHFIQRFLKGTMLYTMGGDSMDKILLEYHYWNRSVVAQELDLTAAQKDSVLAAIQVERAARKHPVPLRLLPGQLLHARARHSRPRARRFCCERKRRG